MAIADTVQSIKTHLGEAYSALEEKQATIPENKNIENLTDSILSVPSGGGGAKMFTGHYDTAGLKAIGWTDEDIKYYQDCGAQWNEELDDLFKLTPSELAGDSSSNTRFLPKNTTVTKFKDYNNLLAVPKTITLSNQADLFRYCYSLVAIPELDASNLTMTRYMFGGCSVLITIPFLDISRVTDATRMFTGCGKLTTIPQLDTSKIQSAYGMFEDCRSLFCLPELDFSKVNQINYLLDNCFYLKYLGGFKNLGQGYSTSSSANYSNYKLDLSYGYYLTHDSLMNVINNLYDIASKGVRTQQIQLTSTSLSLLSPEEIAIATAKGWTVS